ncbi:LysR family transcriptional regulator [Pelagibacterium nitratireducens]|uniref:LysR family transcriptional regulator n=1 Tax=Pelagibacterium nitratireducens TaxID=1046114 RepID=A0ABZ2I0B3_9HYPH
MSKLNINSVDLNLLKVMNAIADTRQITAAGAAIGLSQPAVSHALGRLRKLLNDDLFIRTGHGLQMTSFCAELMPSVRSIMSGCETVFLQSTPFDPRTSSHTFRIGMNDYFSLVLMPPLVSRVSNLAPNCVLEVTHMPRTLGTSAAAKGPLVQTFLDDGEIDIAVMTADKVPARFAAELLYSEERVGIISNNNPASRKQVGLEDLLALQHVKITSDPRRKGWIDERLEALKRKRHVVATVSHFSSAVAIVSQTNLMAVMPKSVALHFKEAFSLSLHSLSFLNLPQATSMIYLKDRVHEASIAWLLDQVRRCFRNGNIN